MGNTNTNINYTGHSSKEFAYDTAQVERFRAVSLSKDTAKDGMPKVVALGANEYYGVTMGCRIKESATSGFLGVVTKGYGIAVEVANPSFAPATSSSISFDAQGRLLADTSGVQVNMFLTAGAKVEDWYDDETATTIKITRIDII